MKAGARIFYRLGHNTAYEREWTYAVSIHPRSHVIKWSCPDCGRAASYPAGAFDVTIEEGTAYPDILQCGAFPLLIVSERVFAAWADHGIGPITTSPVGVVAANETNLLPKDAPPYFRVEVVGHAKVDVPGSGGLITGFCPRCGGFATKPTTIKQFSFLEGSWDGSPIFRDHRQFPSVIFCTDAVVELAKSEGHTNFSFREMLPTPWATPGRSCTTRPTG